MAITIPILTDFNSRGIDRGIKQFQRLETKGQKAGFLIRKAALPAALALGAIGLAAKAGLDGVMADDEALANLQSTITSTGNAANITSESFFAYARQGAKRSDPGHHGPRSRWRHLHRRAKGDHQDPAGVRPDA
jgi:hypothetical protein